MRKIPTLFERRFEGHKIVEVLPKITPGCEEAFLHGIATIKYDGACCAVFDGVLYKRYDAGFGRKIPEGAIPCQPFPDPVTGHLPCWVKCDKDNPADKWFIAARDNLTRKQGITQIASGTYEAVGVHFQGNPYNLEGDTLWRHGTQCVYVERTFEGVRDWLTKVYDEGLVFWRDDEPVCKIKRTDFGLKWGR